MSARSKARKRAVDLIYAAEMRGTEVSDLLDGQAGDNAINPYTTLLIEGLAEHRARIDEVLADYVRGWTLDRMPAVDRNVLRVATFEILYAEDIPDAVAITEAVKLVGDLSTDESPAFVNGVLGNIAKDRAALV